MLPLTGHRSYIPPIVHVRAWGRSTAPGDTSQRSHPRISPRHSTGGFCASMVPSQWLSGSITDYISPRLFYTLTTVFIRLSISVFFIRIFPNRIYKIIIYITMAVVILFSTFYFFLVLFQCSPPNFFWKRKTPGSLVRSGRLTRSSRIHRRAGEVCRSSRRPGCQYRSLCSFLHGRLDFCVLAHRFHLAHPTEPPHEVVPSSYPVSGPPVSLPDPPP